MIAEGEPQEMGGAGAGMPGDGCLCMQKQPGNLACDASGACACTCQYVPCVTEGGLTSTQTCHDDTCEDCSSPPADPRSSTLVLPREPRSIFLTHDEITDVLFGTSPAFGRYNREGTRWETSTDVSLQSLDWLNTRDLVIAKSGNLYMAVRVSAPDATQHDTAVILQSTDEGKRISRTAAPADVVSVTHLTRAPAGKLYAVGTTVGDAPFAAALAEDGSLENRVSFPALGPTIENFAADDQGNFVFAGNGIASINTTSRIALLKAGGKELTEFYDASADTIGQVAADPRGGWWFSTSTKRDAQWVAILHHVGTDLRVSAVAELAAPDGTSWPSAFATGLALLSDSVLLANFSRGIAKGASVARFSEDGKFIQSVNVTDPRLMAAAGTLTATILTSRDGFASIPFAPRHSSN